MSTRILTKGALVTLRARKNKSGTKESLYLDYYHNKKRIYKFLKEFVYVRPRTDSERKLNDNNKKVANEIRTQTESELMNGGYRESKADVSFLAYMETYKSTPKAGGSKRSQGTVRGYDTVIELIREKYGEIKFKDVTDEWVKEFRLHLLSTRDQSTARIYFSKISSALRQAKKDKLIKENPILSADTISKKDVRFEFFSFEEVKALNKADCDIPDLKRAALTSVMTGMRAGDLMALKWRQVMYSDEMGNYIRFEQEKSEQEEYLPIKETVLAILGERGEPDAKVFPKFKNNTNSNAALRVWVARAQINKYITFHDFRHTHAILLGVHGANLFHIKEILGHASISTTEQSYARIIDKTKREIIDKLPDL